MFGRAQSARGLPEEAGKKATKELCARLQQPDNQKHAQQSVRKELWYTWCKFVQKDQQGHPSQPLWVRMWTGIPCERGQKIQEEDAEGKERS